MEKHAAAHVQLCDNTSTNKKFKCPYNRKYGGQFYDNQHYACWDRGTRHQFCDKCCEGHSECPACGVNKAIPERKAQLVGKTDEKTGGATPPVAEKKCENDNTKKRLRCPRRGHHYTGPFYNNKHYTCWGKDKRHVFCDHCCKSFSNCPVDDSNKCTPPRKPDKL